MCQWIANKEKLLDLSKIEHGDHQKVRIKDRIFFWEIAEKAVKS